MFGVPEDVWIYVLIYVSIYVATPGWLHRHRP